MSRPSLESKAAEALSPENLRDLDQPQRLAVYKQFLEKEEEEIHQLHRAGSSGIEIAKKRTALFDEVLTSILHDAGRRLDTNPESLLALVATGGYGRGLLNPGSDIDVLFLLPGSSTKLPKSSQEIVQDVLYVLWDVGFKVGHASRSIRECIQQASLDQHNRTALIDARLIAGNKTLFQKLETVFEKECMLKGQDKFFDLRRHDIRSRHEKYSHTVFLQEPNVKESCGGMRDYQNVEWIARVKTGAKDLSELVEMKLLTQASLRKMNEAYDFLHRVRNELHYQNGKANDQLTLHLQGVVSTAFHYPQRNILRMTEAFMRDYYRHTRHIFQRTTSLLEAFQIEIDDRADSGIRSFLSIRKKKREEFDGFVSRKGRLYPANINIFKEDNSRLMRLFRHCQQRELSLSPPLRRLIAQHWNDVDRSFRYSTTNREVFQSILEKKGEVARVLRLMHRISFLGRYLPEFGALDCLVQHEFFHRYTADEHTLRCIDQLDLLVSEEKPGQAIYRKLFHEIRDPYALYLAIILHDTGRAENVREHTDGSAILASRLCNRLKIRGARRSLITFLLDNHLTFWRTATSKNLDDPAVIAEFASIMKTRSNLDALLLFTYVDSNGTSLDAWTGWKESLMLQLHTATRHFLAQGEETYSKKLSDERLSIRDEVLKLMRDQHKEAVDEHFERMPRRAFHFRQAKHIVEQIKAVEQFVQREKDQTDTPAFSIKWIDHNNRGFSQVILVSREQALLLEKACCALASEQINILSADLYTRSDGIVVNLFRVCTTDFDAVSDPGIQKRFKVNFESILPLEDYHPEKYLKRRTNFLKKEKDHDIPVPVRAYVSNKEHPTCTTVELQAFDRIGLLHDLFHIVNLRGFNTVHARICTEKGVAIDSLYITDADGRKIEDPGIIQDLTKTFTQAVSRS